MTVITFRIATEQCWHDLHPLANFLLLISADMVACAYSRLQVEDKMLFDDMGRHRPAVRHILATTHQPSPAQQTGGYQNSRSGYTIRICFAQVALGTRMLAEPLARAFELMVTSDTAIAYTHLSFCLLRRGSLDLFQFTTCTFFAILTFDIYGWMDVCS